MKISLLIKVTLGVFTSFAFFSPPTHADISITAVQGGGDVVLSYSGSIRTAELSNAANELRSGSIAPKNSLIQFATTSGSEILGGFGSSVSSTPDNFGPGSTNFASSKTGDSFSITSQTVAFPGGYQSGAPLAGTITFSGESLASLGIISLGRTYVWTLSNGERVTLRVVNPNRAKILRDIRKFKKKERVAERKGQRSKVRRFKKKIRILRRRL